MVEQKIKVGETGAITIATTNATACSEPTLGDIPVNGNINITPTGGGRVTYAIKCVNGAKSATTDLLVITPYPFSQSSYENKQNSMKAPYLAMVNYAAWVLWEKSKPEGFEGGVFQSSYTSADLRQDGTQIFVVAMSVAPKGLDANPTVVKPVKGRVYFIEQVGPYSGRQTKMKDVTSEFVSDTSSCYTMGRLLISDYNNDGKPDIVGACNGTDENAHLADPLYNREPSRILLSTESGRYTNTEIPGMIGYPHGATADDINGDGNTDLIFTHIYGIQTGGDNFIVRMGDGTGNFTIDNSRIALKHRTGTMGVHAWAVELIKLKGDTVPTLFVSGGINLTFDWCTATAPCDTQPHMLKNVNGYYANPVVFPLAGVSSKDEALIDFVYDEKRNKIIVAAGVDSYKYNAHYSIDLSTKEYKVLGGYTTAECMDKIDPSYSMCHPITWGVYGDFLEQRNADNLTKFNLNW